MSSNEGLFMAISRFLVVQWPTSGWYSWWMNGVPFENTYSPLLQIVDAVSAKVAHSSTALAFHRTLAFFYCLGPVCLFWFAWRMSSALYPSFLCGLVYSLTSPSVLFPAVRSDVGGWFHARRLHTLVHYGEGAHNVALSLLPVALLCAWLAMEERRFRWCVATGAVAGILVLTNAFAAVDLVIGILCLIVVRPRGSRLRSLSMLALTGIIAYAWISPLLTPTLIQTIRRNSMIGVGYQITPGLIVTGLLVLAGAFVIWQLTIRLDAILRFSLVFAYVFFLIPALSHFARIAVVPQPERYHLEMELGLSLAAVFAARCLPPRVRVGLAAVMALALGAQVNEYVRFARGLIQCIDITQTIEYKTARWLDQNLPDQKAMVSGDTGTWFNVFSGNTQLSGGADPFSPNWMLEIAVYTIYVTEDPNTSITWLKAFGCQAITVPGVNSRESSHPYHQPHKFDGVLPVLWHEEDDTIYAVPQRSKSLAHVVPDSAVIGRAPIHGLDTADVERFVAALEDPTLPLADFRWRDTEHAWISTSAQAGQSVAVQITYDPRWVAQANGKPARITRDGIGLVTIHPQCAGPCEVELSWDGGLERRVCRIVSLLVMLAVAAAAALAARRNAAHCKHGE
jgi:hypothetical protein